MGSNVLWERRNLTLCSCSWKLCASQISDAFEDRGEHENRETEPERSVGIGPDLERRSHAIRVSQFWGQLWFP